jgi:hypothetical protein
MLMYITINTKRLFGLDRRQLMGCSITCTAYKKLDDGRFSQVPTDTFNDKNYNNTAFLADVRNDTGIIPMPFGNAERPGPLPASLCPERVEWYWDTGPDALVWFTVDELLEFDYSRPCRADGNETYREFLGKGYLDDIENLRVSGATHVMFELNS